MIKYIDFYKRFGIRRKDQIMRPPLPMMSRLRLPALSLVHYLPETPLELGPNDGYPLFQGNNKPIRIEHITTLNHMAGNPRPIVGDQSAKLRLWRRENPRFKPFADLSVARRDPGVLVVENYCAIPHMYKYGKLIGAPYYRTSNFIRTVLDNVDRLTGNGYNQFLQMKLPRYLPTVNELDFAQNNMNTKGMAKFSNVDMFTLLQIWIWLGPKREQGVCSDILTRVSDELNLVIFENGRWCLLNLGVLNKIRGATRNEIAKWEESIRSTEEGVKVRPDTPEPIRRGMLPSAVQKMFLRMLMGITDARRADVEERLGDEGVVPVSDTALPGEDPSVGSSEVSDAEFTEYTMDNERLAVDVVEEDLLVPDETSGRAIELDLETLNEIQQEVESTEEAIDPDAEVTPSELAQANATPDEDLSVLEARALAKDVATGFDTPDNTVSNFQRLLAKAADNGTIGVTDYRRLMEKSTRIDTIQVDGQPLSEFIKVTPEMLAVREHPTIPDRDTIVDKSMLKSTLLDFNARYVRNVMQRDIAAMVVNLQNAGYAIGDYQPTRVEDITGSRTEFAIPIDPIEGKSGMLRFMIPDANESGEFMVAGTKYRTRMQRGDLPIRKVNPGRVALNSYYAPYKLFIDRSERRVANYPRWVKDNVRGLCLEGSGSVIGEFELGSAFEHEGVGVRDYTILAQGFRRLEVKVGGKSYDCQFYSSKIPSIFTAETIAWCKANKATPVGLADDGSFLATDRNRQWYSVNNEVATTLGTLEDVFQLNAAKAPLEFAEMQVFGKLVPVGLCLGYLMGFKALLAKLKIKPRIVPRGERAKLEPDEWRVVFDDETWVFDRKDTMACMVFGGLTEFDEVISQFPSAEFDKKEVYFNVFDSKRMSVRYLRELDNLEALFVDPITRDLLIAMKEPTIFRELLIRCAQLLCTDQHPHELDSKYMRIKGYERFAGLLYGELCAAVRTHNGRPGKSRYPLELKPYAVWTTIVKDPAKDQVSEINPIQNTKEQEAVTMGGIGGRGSRSMVKRTRIFPESDRGTISESTVDSGDVAINIFTTANPLFNSLRGTSDRYSKENGMASLISTSAMASPGSTKDDPRRVMLMGIQNRHVVPCAAYTQSMIRTGGEQVIPYRTGDLFCTMAKEEGKVISVSETGVVVQYNDGEKIGVELGRRYGNASGVTIAHNVKCELKLGDTVAKGSVIAYNPEFFERDLLNPEQVIWKSAMLARVALMESPDTLEDSSAISMKLAERLSTKATKVKDIVVSFNQAIHQMVSVGEEVGAEDALCVIEDELSARNNLLDESTVNTLRALSSNTPTAKVHGTIERIEVFYNGDLEDMSPTLRKLAVVSDKGMSERLASANKKAYTGSVNSDFRIGADPLLLDEACIRVYITSDVPAGVGDKGVFGNQLKTVFGRIFNDDIVTESNVPLDAIFGARSVGDRMVISPYSVGTSNVISELIGKRFVEAYEAT